MKRDFYTKLLEWKQSEDRKPLILKGARQVGKTYILKEFGKNEYTNTAYFNFEEDPNLKDFFIGRLQPERILELYYWTRNSTAEVDFLVHFRDGVYPLEVKAGAGRGKTSLTIYGEKYSPPVLSRTTTMNFRKEKNLCNFPLYGISYFPRLAANF